MHIYFICPVRRCTPELKPLLDAHVAKLEAEGHTVHYPHRDVDQTADAFAIAMAHLSAMTLADAVHVWWDPDSYGSHVDLGMALAFWAKLYLVNADEFVADKYHDYTDVVLELGKPKD